MPLIAGTRTDRIGGYTLGSPVSVGVRESLWEAIDPTGGPCVLEICERFDETPVSGEAVGAFIERAALQRRVARQAGPGVGLGGGHIVGVDALEATAFGAMLARGAYAVSAADLVAGKVRLRGDALHEIVAGVLGGLVKFRAIAGRPHGRLDGEAVLIDGPGPGRLRVGLRAPATAGELNCEADPAVDEMRCLGLLIFELVLHRPFREMGGYPVRDGSEWQSLGRHGGVWLGLVNDLLKPGGTSLTLDEVAARVAGLAFKIDGPGAGVWLGRAAMAAAAVGVVGAGVWLVFRPGVEPVRAEFTDASFERWLRAVPMVVSIRDAAAEDDVPGVIVRAAEAAVLSAAEQKDLRVGDLFEIPPLFEAADLGRAFPRLGGRSLESVLGTVSSRLAEIEAEATGGSDREKDLDRFRRLAGLFEAGLTRIDGTEGRAGMLGMFAPENWEARGLVDGLVGAEGFGWLDASASGLFEETAGAVRSAVERIAGGVTEPELFAAATAEDPLAGGRIGAVDDLVAAAREAESIASVATAWRDELFPAIERDASAIVERAGWPSLPPGVRDRLPGDGDPLLASFADVPERVGVVVPGETAMDLDARLRAGADAAAAIRQYLEESWSAEGVDLLTLDSWIDARRDRIASAPAGSGAGDVAGWIDARFALSEAWLSAARDARVIDEASWVVTGFLPDVAASRALWAEAQRDASDDTRDAEIEAFGRTGVVRERLDAIAARIEALRSLPRWPSLEEEASGERDAIASDFSTLRESVERIYNDVLMPPEELIALWRAEPPRLGTGYDGLLAARGRVGEALIGAWESWAAASGADEQTRKRADETDALRVGLRAIDEVVGRAAARSESLLEQDRSFGSFSGPGLRAAMRTRLVELDSAAIAEASGWGDKRVVADGGAIGARFGGAEDPAPDILAEWERRVTELAYVAEAIGRGYTPGERFGDDFLPDRGGLEERLAAFREGSGLSWAVGLEPIAAAVRAVEGLVEIERIDATDRLIDALVAEAGASGRAGIAVAAARRLDELGRDRAGGWPASSADLARTRSDLADGFGSLRASLQEADWERVSSELAGIVRGWWLRGVGLAADRGSFASAVDDASTWFDGVDPAWSGLLGSDLLEGRNRFNAGVIEIRSEIRSLADAAIAEAARADRSAIPAIDRRLLDGVTGELDRVEALASQTLDDADRRRGLAWVESFRSSLREARQGRRGWEAEEHGPLKHGFAGWRAELDEDAEPPVVRYLKDAPAPEDRLVVEFRLISDLPEPDGGQVFLSVDEVSVGVCAEIMRYGSERIGGAISEWFEVFDDNPRAPKFRGDLLEGPTSRDPFVRGRNEMRNRLQASQAWLSGVEYGPPVEKASYPAYPAGLVSASAPDRISDSQGGEPDLFCPVNYIPDRLAREAAEAFGCRLPTAAEFAAALGMVPGVDSGRWNLRDGTFSQQLAHYEEALAFGVTQYQPGKWSYDGRESIRDEVWRLPVASADDRLWFYRVGASGTADDAFGQGVLFRHLIGNVAEYVLEREGDDEVRVMGASALSDPAIRPGDIRPSDGPTRGTNGFVDVGFRLAIDADDFGSLGKMVRKQIAATEGAAFLGPGG